MSAYYGIPSQVNTSTDPAATKLASNTLVTIANDGTAAVAWYDGTNQQLSSAAAPYTSWATTELMASHRFATSLQIKDAGGDLAVLACDNIQGINYLVATKSGAAYSVGAGNYIGAGGSTFNAGQPEILVIDPQGRYWSISNQATPTSLAVYESATPSSGVWTSSLTATLASNAQMPVAALVGNYLVIVYEDASSAIVYQRLDVSQASLGAWSAATAVPNVAGTPGSTNTFCLRGNSAGSGLFVYDSNAGIQVQIYDAAADTWGTATALTSSANDVQPTAVAVGNDFYVYFCQYAAANSYALAWTHYSHAASAWDLSIKQLVGAGTAISNPNVGYANNVIGVAYTVGTSSPYSVSFVTMTTAKPTFSIPGAMPIISRVGGSNAYTNDPSGGSYPASNANNATYNDLWRCATTPTGGADSGELTQAVYVAYDLSSVSSSQRQQVLVVWYNDPTTGPYRPDLISNNPANIPTSYTIDVNTAAGGAYPSSGWTTLVTVANSAPYHSRQHLVDMAGANWIRINITAITGSVANNNAQLNMDVFDAHLVAGLQGVQNSWIAYGDSITQAAFLHEDMILPQQVNNLVGNQLPVIESGGIGGWTSTNLLPQFATFLALFPGQFVLINMGTNDADQGGSYLPTYEGNMDAMVKMVLAAGKIPIIQHIPWGRTANLQTNVPTLNAQLDSIVASNPGTITGWDAYAWFNTHQSDINTSDNIHPTTQGYLDYQAQWAAWAEQSIYSSGDPDTFAFDWFHFAVQQ